MKSYTFVIDRNDVSYLIAPYADGLRVQFYAVDGSFDQGVTALKQQGVELISTRDLALSRCLARHGATNSWSMVAENFVYDNERDADVLVVAREHAPILKNPAAATAAHRSRREFSDFNYGVLRERADADPAKAIESGVLLLTRASIKDSRTYRKDAEMFFEHDPLAEFLFRDVKLVYGANWDCVSRPWRARIPVHIESARYARKKDVPFARPMSLSEFIKPDMHGGVTSVIDGIGLGYWSSLRLRSNHSIYGRKNRVSGVRFVEGSAEPDAPLERRV